MEGISLKTDFHMVQAETSEYILHTPYKSYFIPEIFYEIICLLQQECSIDEIAETLKEKITANGIEEILSGSFKRMGIISGSTYEQKKKYRMLIWKKDLIAPIKLYHEPLISKILNIYFIIGAILVYVIVYGYGLIHWGNTELLKDHSFTFNQGIVTSIYLIAFYISGFVHELGHYFSCIWYGGTPGKIGIGIYIITPVLYASLDDIWRLDPKKRNMVNLSGVYFQSLFLLLFALLAIIHGLKIPFIICLIGSFTALVNLVPFLKLDGYWIVTDYLNTNNLMSQSINYLNNIVKKEKNQNIYRSNNPIKQKVFQIYSILFGAFMFIYTIFFLKILYNSITTVYELIRYNQITVSMFVLFLRSIFILFTAFKVISVLYRMRTVRNRNHNQRQHKER